MRARHPVFSPAALVLLIAPVFAASATLASPGAGSAPGSNRAPDSEWQEIGLLQVEDQCSIFDASRGELLSLGGSQHTNWALPLRGPQRWQPLPAMSSAMPINARETVEDPATGLVYVAGFGANALEIRTLDPRTGRVTPLVASGTPPVVAQTSLLFDPVQQRLLVFGGFVPDPDFGFAPTNRVWALELQPAPAWIELSPTGTPPPRMGFPSTVLDPVRRYLLIPDARQPGPSDVWALTLDGAPEWRHFPTNGLPLGVNPNPFVYDPGSDRVWTVDGQLDVFSLSPVNWQWQKESPARSGPSPRSFVGIAVDTDRHRLLVSGGMVASGVDTHADTWALSLDRPATWKQLTPDEIRPPVRAAASDALDPARDRLIVFGGADEVGGFRNDTWTLDLGTVPTWSELAPRGGPPPPRYWHASAWDPRRDQMLVFGGGFDPTSGKPLGDLWALSFGGGAPAWTRISPAGSTPSARVLTNLVYDSARDRFLLLFGFDGTSQLADVWELRLSPAPVWRALAPTGTPPSARSGAMAAYEPAHDRVIVFGGGTLNDLWALDLGAGGDGVWQPLPTPTQPPGRNLGLLRLDTQRDRMLLFGGFGFVEEPENTIEWQDDLWALDLRDSPAWERLAPAGFTPLARDRANGAYDAFRDRLVLTCGAIGSAPANDTWALAFAESRGAGAAERTLVGPVPEQSSLRALSLAARAVAGRLVFTVELPSGEPASLAIFDLAGRRMWSRSIGQLGAGTHSLSADDAALPPALYFAVLTQGAASRTARVALTR